MTRERTQLSSFLEDAVNKIAASAFVILLSLGYVGATPASANSNDASAEARAGEKTLVVDVFCDARTFSVNGGRRLPDLRRGDAFIVNGKVFAGGTIPAGGTPEAPSTFDPEPVESIGNWVCRATSNFDMEEMLAGAVPHASSSQYFFLGDGDAIYSEGPEGGTTVQRTIIGGTGKYAGIVGEVTEEPIGVNSTGLFNIRFTFKFKKQPRR
jgi:hypothetical protein